MVSIRFTSFLLGLLLLLIAVRDSIADFHQGMHLSSFTYVVNEFKGRLADCFLPFIL